MKMSIIPSRIAAQNLHEALLSIVAVGEDGRLAGHCALERNREGPVAEIGQAAVDPAHRGRGLLDRMKGALEREAQALGLVGWYRRRGGGAHLYAAVQCPSRRPRLWRRLSRVAQDGSVSQYRQRAAATRELRAVFPLVGRSRNRERCSCRRGTRKWPRRSTRICNVRASSANRLRRRKNMARSP